MLLGFIIGIDGLELVRSRSFELAVLSDCMLTQQGLHTSLPSLVEIFFFAFIRSCNQKCNCTLSLTKVQPQLNIHFLEHNIIYRYIESLCQ